MCHLRNLGSGIFHLNVNITYLLCSQHTKNHADSFFQASHFSFLPELMKTASKLVLSFAPGTWKWACMFFFVPFPQPIRSLHEFILAGRTISNSINSVGCKDIMLCAYIFEAAFRSCLSLGVFNAQTEALQMLPGVQDGRIQACPLVM